MAIRIRNIQSSDLPACRALWVELTQTHRDLFGDDSIGGDAPEQYFDKHLKRISAEHIWVAEENGSVIGLIGLIINDPALEEGTAQIEPVIVAHEQRGRGIGQSLINHAIKQARQAGVDFLCVKAVTRNHAAIALYHSCGFQVLAQVELLLDISQAKPGIWKSGLHLLGHDFNY